MTYFRVGAAVMLLVIIGAAVLYWPLPALGVAVDPPSGLVLAVAEDSAGAQAGVQVGDQIVNFYGHSWASLNTRLLVVPLPWRLGTESPMTIRRNNALFDLTLKAEAPEISFQIDKALRTLVALICWGTGVALATSRQRDDRRLQWAAWFWLFLGGALGLYPLAMTVSYVLTAGVLWILLTLLAPTAVMMHMWYPIRPQAPQVLQQALRWWLPTLALLQLLFLGLAIASGRTTSLLVWLDTGTTVVYLICFVLSALILLHAHWTTRVAHVRRQIRLVVAACLVVACGWAILLLGEALAPQLIAAIPPVTLTVLAALVPLAYLLGAIRADLLRIDLFARRVGVHAGTLAIILLLATAATQLQLVDPTPLLVAVLLLAAYQPVFQLVQRLARLLGGGEDMGRKLSHITTKLGSTLNARRLARIVQDGLRVAYREPPVAIYLRCDAESDVLGLATWQQLDLPQIVSLSAVQQAFRQGETLLPIGTVQQRVGGERLSASDAELVFAPVVNLWGVIRTAKGALLGLVILGPRGDLDPYREEDLRELGQLLAAAALALTNSLSYARQVQAGRLIRWLYRHLQQVQDKTESAIARELHDEVLNVNVRHNIHALDKLLVQAATVAPELVDELQALLESEESTATLIRLICEELRPAYTDDPLGLASSLRRTIERLATTWEGEIHLEVEQAPVPVERHTHRELVMIAREGIANAIKHADATEIVVRVCFPTEEDEPLILTISDNGFVRRKVAPKEGHFGLYFMRESADAVGATIEWLMREAGGTEVRVVAPLAAHHDVSLLAALSPWWNDETFDDEDSFSALIDPTIAGPPRSRNEADQ